MSKLPATSSPLDRGDVVVAIGLASIVAWLFRDHLFGKLVFLGNPDRIHNNLKVLKFYVDNIAQGVGLQAWNEHELLGYDTFALPYINPSPLTYLVAAFGSENLYVTAGFVSALLLALAGIVAYFFLRAVAGQRLPAAAASCLYMLAAITVLKVSQNDASFLVFVLIPPLLLATRTASPERLTHSVWSQAILLYLLMQFTFLQKAAYALLLWGSYALFLAFQRRDRSLLAIPALAFAGAFTAALPRIAGVAMAMPEYTRGSAEELTKAIPTHPLEFLRWFDTTIFGRIFGDEVSKVSSVNLSEGFLLYTATFVPFILLFSAFRAPRAGDGEQRFFSWTVTVLFSVIVLPWMMELVWLLFAKINFIHARILIAALLPLLVLVAIRLRDLQPESSTGPAFAIVGVIVAGLVVVTIEGAAIASTGAVALSTEFITWLDEAKFVDLPAPAALERGALVRIAITGLATVVIVWLIRSSASPGIRKVAYIALLAAPVLQAGTYANFQLRGEHTVDELPFRDGNISWTDGGKLPLPSAEERSAMRTRLDSANFRSVAICDRRIGGGFCAAQFSEYWGLRLADGYYGFGTPSRIAVLPWSGHLGKRDLSFGDRKKLPWPILGFLNVRFAVPSGPYIYGRTKATSGHRNVEIIENPEPVLPRAFLARNVTPVRSAREAAERIFKNARPYDVREMSFVEEFDGARSFSNAGGVALSGFGDELVVELDASPHPRFLVVNELYNPRWTAEIDGRSARVYAANAVMRGVVVPPGSQRIVLRYTPIASLRNCVISLLLGMLLLQGTAMVRRRGFGSRRTWLPGS